jgi:hypothetical protein
MDVRPRDGKLQLTGKLAAPLEIPSVGFVRHKPGVAKEAYRTIVYC